LLLEKLCHTKEYSSRRRSSWIAVYTELPSGETAVIVADAVDSVNVTSGITSFPTVIAVAANV